MKKIEYVTTIFTLEQWKAVQRLVKTDIENTEKLLLEKESKGAREHLKWQRELLATLNGL